MTGRLLICVSLTRADARRLADGGPRRDMDALAERAGATLMYAPSGRRRGVLARFTGPHVLQAWRAARAARDYDVVMADGEHIGIPFIVFAAILGRRVRTAMIVHQLDSRWKRGLLWAASRLQRRATVFVHSTTQAAIARSATPSGWDTRLVPYQVDTEYWRRDATAIADETSEPIVLAVGAESRDYRTLVEAARGLPARVVIAAGSHWARSTAEVPGKPDNVEVMSGTLGFRELRALYARALVVAVPLRPAGNQSGVTTILEAMSMGLPVVVTATPGQREVVRGPLVTASGFEREATRDRGPQAFGAPDGADTGLYVAPGDAAGLRQALEALLADGALRARLGEEGVRVARAHFDVDGFAGRIAASLAPQPMAPPAPAAEPA